MKKINYLSLFIVLSFAITMFSCQDSTNSLDDQPPELPPVESMNMEFSNFDESVDSGNSELNAENETYSHFTNAAIRAMVMKGIVSTNLAIPKALIAAAENSDPELTDDGEWTWSYASDASGDNFEVRLHASEGSDGRINWQMFVTNSGLDLDDVLLFEGDVNQDGTEGTWIYYALFGDESGNAVSQIDWEIENEEQTELRLEVLSDRNGHAGDSIDYRFDAPVKRAEYYNAGDDLRTEIEWNIETKEGYLVSPNYNNGEQACWNGDFQDVECG